MSAVKDKAEALARDILLGIVSRRGQVRVEDAASAIATAEAFYTLEAEPAKRLAEAAERVFIRARTRYEVVKDQAWSDLNLRPYREQMEAAEYEMHNARLLAEEEKG